MLSLNLKCHPSVPSFIKKEFSLIFGFNLPNFTTLGGCPLKNWTFVQSWYPTVDHETRDNA